MRNLLLAALLFSTFAFAGTDQDLLVPSYFYPSQWQANDWDVMAAKHSAHQIVIANDANGMATSKNSDYATDDAMPNPWDALATYNSSMVDAVAP